jgi:PAS domain S-box-containing protein
LADECGGALQRIRDAEALRATQERFRELASTIDEVFWVSDPSKNQVFYVSPAYAKIWGRSCQSLYEEPRSWLEAIHPEDRERILHAATTRQVTAEYDEEYRILRPDGEVRWIRDRAFPVHGQNGSVERVVGVARDVTKRKALEEQIRQSQKLEAVGQLAAGIAHDFNNILAAVLGNTQLALAETGLNPSTGECLTEIKNAAVRARGLIQQILAFSRQQPQERIIMALGPLVHEVAGLLRATIPPSVEIRVAIDESAPLVLADSTQMHQVLVNLGTNAWHALEDKPGCIELKLQAATLDSAAGGRLEGLKSGRYARLSVRDNGKGMDANSLKHIFEPFFTTKEPGKGTGLGLSVVHGIVHDHEGVVSVSSQLEHGALFEVYLPEAGAATHRSSETDSLPRRGQGQCILYLDDEKTLVHLATRMLNRLGYQVFAFTNATDALKAFGENPARFALVITDLNMPGASGLEVAGALLKVRPDVPVMLTSGHITEYLSQCASKAGIRKILHKPVTIEEFGEHIHRLVGESTQR